MHVSDKIVQCDLLFFRYDHETVTEHDLSKSIQCEFMKINLDEVSAH